MKVHIGRIVRIQLSTRESLIAPAIVTRVHGEEGQDTRNASVVVNLTAFPDLAAPEPHEKIAVFDNERDAAASGLRPVAWAPPGAQ
jgi:hypothetical protein